MGVEAHPDADGETIRISQLVNSVRGGRIAIVPHHERTYYIRHVGDQFEVLCVNRNGAFCWCRAGRETRAKNLMESSAEAGFSVTIGQWPDDWPSAYSPGGGR